MISSQEEKTKKKKIKEIKKKYRKRIESLTRDILVLGFQIDRDACLWSSAPE